MTGVSFNYRDLGKALARFKKLRVLFLDFNPVWNELMHWHHDEMVRKFNRGGPGWRSLAQSTTKARARRWGYYRKNSSEGASRRIGVWTGRMMDIVSARRSKTTNDGGKLNIVRRKRTFKYSLSYPKLKGFEKRRKVIDGDAFQKKMGKLAIDYIRKSFRKT